MGSPSRGEYIGVRRQKAEGRGQRCSAPRFAPLRPALFEGVVRIDGATHGVVLREGIMTLALNTVFEASPRPARVVAYRDDAESPRCAH